MLRSSKIAFCVLVLFLSGCTIPFGAAKQNLKNWELVSGAHRTYLDADASLSDPSKKARKLFLDEAVNLAKSMVEDK